MKVGLVSIVMLVIALDSLIGKSEVFASCGSTATSEASGTCTVGSTGIILKFIVRAQANDPVVTCKRNSGQITLSLECQTCSLISPCIPGTCDRVTGIGARGLQVVLKDDQGNTIATATTPIGSASLIFPGLSNGTYQIESAVVFLTDSGGVPLNPPSALCTIDTLCVKVANKLRNCTPIFCCSPCSH